jgi:hypothetical protein
MKSGALDTAFSGVREERARWAGPNRIGVLPSPGESEAELQRELDAARRPGGDGLAEER